MNNNFSEKAGETAVEAGKRFFEGEYDATDFIKKKLKKGDYEYLAVFAQTAVAPVIDYRLVEDSEKSFRILMELFDRCNITEDAKEKLIYSVYKASEKSMLKRWTDSADEYFARKIFANPGFAYTLLKKDTTGLAYPLILQVGKSRGEEIIVKALLTFNVANRAKARRLIYGSRVAISLISAYEEMNVRQRGEFVRLMLLDKRNPESVQFIKDVYYGESSKRIVNAIRKEIITPYAHLQPQEYREDEKSLYSPFFCGRNYKIRIKNFKVKKAVSQDLEVNTQIKKRAALVKAELKACINDLFDRMVSCSRWPAEMFLERLNEDKLFYYMCDKLFFAMYNGEYFEDIVIVSDGKILTADGKRVNIENKQIMLAHPLMFSGRYAYLTMQNDLNQPFAQIDRPVFVPSDTDRTFNYVNRFSGSVITVGQLKKRTRGTGFHLKRDTSTGDFGWLAMLWQGVYCVAKLSEFDENDNDGFVRAERIQFYEFKDVAKKMDNGKWESAKVMPISNINPALFSEFMLILSGVFGA
ncbi:MAG: DUF4132 domain-containing protein [Clostridia bacterium]|nr:DUF4132 domain-containing protein [Clostridia bacterium]